MTPNKKLLREALEKIAVCMPGSIMSRIATDALAATEQPVTYAPVAIFEGYVDGKPRIAWTGAPLPAGTELYAALATAEQPARQDAAYAELRALAEKASLGPWRVTIGTGATEVRADREAPPHTRIARCLINDSDYTRSQSDAAYIAAANPAAILTLIADNDRLTERVRDLETAANGIVAGTVSFMAKERTAQDERVAVLEAAQVPDGMVIAPHYRGYANLGTGQYVLNHSKAGEPMEFVISVATEAEKAGRVVGDERDNEPDALLQPEAMAVRIAFASLAGLEALENQLRKMKLEHGVTIPRPHADEAAKVGQTAAARDVLAERDRQRTVEGWIPEHDDNEHVDGSMARAAACYALHTEPVGNVGDYLRFWPWASRWWKPTNRRRNLVKASALILAEIERLDRATPPSPAEGEPDHA